MEMELPGAQLAPEKMPGHWLLAQLGKRVLRPGGLEMTRELLSALEMTAEDDVVEFAPGLGLTTQMALNSRPKSYVAIERDKAAAQYVSKLLPGEAYRCEVRNAQDTGLPDGSASLEFGEAMVTMQPHEQKKRIIQEAARVLRPGGRYGIHEICLTPDDVPQLVRDDILRGMSQAIHVGVRPLTWPEWSELLQSAGLEPVFQSRGGFRLLEPQRLVKDEGLVGALRFFSRVARNKPARQRVLMMRGVFRKYAAHLNALAVVAVKKV
jgi:SAM-dependent methyltransferase